MSRQLLNNYYNKLDETIRYGGSRNETSVEHAFKETFGHVHRRKFNTYSYAGYKVLTISIPKPQNELQSKRDLTITAKPVLLYSTEKDIKAYYYA